MRMDKLTSQFQQALSEAQSLAVGHSHSFIEPVHLLKVLLEQKNGTTAHILNTSHVNVPGLSAALGDAIEHMPHIQGHTGEVHVSNDLARLLNLSDKYAQQRGDQYIATELFILAACDDNSQIGQLLKKYGAVKNKIEQAITTLRHGKSSQQ